MHVFNFWRGKYFNGTGKGVALSVPGALDPVKVFNNASTGDVY